MIMLLRLVNMYGKSLVNFPSLRYAYILYHIIAQPPFRENGPFLAIFENGQK